MHVLELPALHSDDPLGFMASIGLVEACATGLGVDIRLAWGGLGGSARIESEFPSVDDLVDALHGLAQHLAGERRVAPPSDPSLITPRLSDAERRARIAERGYKPPNDPMRMEIGDAIARYAAVQAQELAGDSTVARWTMALVGQLSPVEKAGAAGYCDLTPLYAPAGQQTIYQLYDKYTALVASSRRYIVEAVTGWRRTVSDSGANLDWRDIRDGAATTSGKSENAGVPGATWLALQGVPFFRLVGDGIQGDATGWLRTSRRGRPRAIRWPVWEPMLDRPAITALLEHPEVRAASLKPGTMGASRNMARSEAEGRRAASLKPEALEALGVVALLESTRRSSGNSDGPLRPPEVVWAA